MNLLVLEKKVEEASETLLSLICYIIFVSIVNYLFTDNSQFLTKP